MLDKIIKWFDGQKKMAMALGISEPAISIWKRDGIPPLRAIEIEEITNGEFKAVDIVRSEDEGEDDK